MQENFESVCDYFGILDIKGIKTFKPTSISIYLYICTAYFNSFMTEVSKSICFVNQWAGFYMIGTSVMKELITKC